jgi:predicted RNA-binding protein YlxR (DUF448 family)
VTRAARPAEELIRFVRAPDGTVVADLKRRLPGRGVWVSARREIVAEAVRRKAFVRGFKEQVTVPGDLPDTVEALLERAVLDMLSLANKAGRAVAGFGKVETALQGGKAAAVLHARDGAEDGKRKLAQAARRSGAEVPVIELFSSGQLGLALGRENVIHAALLADPVSDAFLARAHQLLRYRQSETGQGSDAGLAAEMDQE